MAQVVQPQKLQVVVTRPRACDAVGSSLRNAFLRDVAVPDDMVDLLHCLNGNGGMRSH